MSLWDLLHHRYALSISTLSESLKFERSKQQSLGAVRRQTKLVVLYKDNLFDASWDSVYRNHTGRWLLAYRWDFPLVMLMQSV